tara:strand:- start:314 stop:487 length:174 start_codon:yes stop_codon:yes gene_type:complete
LAEIGGGGFSNFVEKLVELKAISEKVVAQFGFCDSYFEQKPYLINPNHSEKKMLRPL